MSFLLGSGRPRTWALLLSLPILLHAATPVSGWRSTGPYGASVEKVVFVDRSGGRELLAVTSNAFLYRTQDGGDHWSLIRFPAQHIALAHALAVDPHRPGSFAVGVSSQNPALAGLYATQDDGLTWTHVLRDVAVFSVAYAPSNPNLIAAGTKTGVLFSEDGGATWRRISPLENKELQPVMSLGFDPRNADVLYAGTPHLPWKTSDRGNSWTSIHHGMIDDSDILALIVNQKKPEQLFIGACSGIYRSDNSASRWNKLLGITGAGFRTYSVALDPANPDLVYSGTRDGLWKSADLGRTWRKLAPNIVKAVAVSPNDSKTVFLATEDAGILRSRDGGESFLDASNGLSDRRMIRMVQSGRQVLVTLGKDASTVRATLGDNPNWQRVRLPASSVQQILNYGKSLVAFSNSSAWTSADNGVTWKPMPAFPVAMSAAGFGVSSQVPMIATTKAVYRLSGQAWQPATALGASAGPIRRMWTTRSGVGPAWIEAGASIWTSADAGKTWTIAHLPVRPGELYELDASPQVIWAATARGLFRSRDAGKTWTLCDKGIDAGSTTPAVAIHPASPLEAFAVQYGKIFRTRDGGESWVEVPVEGLQGASIASLAVTAGADVPDAASANPQQLVALTSARGVFVHELKALDTAMAASSTGAAAPASTATSPSASSNQYQEK